MAPSRTGLVAILGWFGEPDGYWSEVRPDPACTIQVA